MNYPRHWNAIAILIFFGMAGKRLPLSSFISLMSSKLHRVISSPSLHQIGWVPNFHGAKFYFRSFIFSTDTKPWVMYKVFFFSVILKFPNMSISEKQKAGICYGTSICFLILPYKRCLPSKGLIFFIQNFLGWTWLFFFSSRNACRKSRRWQKSDNIQYKTAGGAGEGISL